MSENNGNQKEICDNCKKEQCICCDFCGKENCKSNFHHTIRCVYCKQKMHSCCNDDCREIKVPAIPAETNLVEEIESVTTKKLEEINTYKIDMGTNPLYDGVCNSEVCQLKWQMNVWKLA